MVTPPTGAAVWRQIAADAIGRAVIRRGTAKRRKRGGRDGRCAVFRLGGRHREVVDGRGAARLQQLPLILLHIFGDIARGLAGQLVEEPALERVERLFPVGAGAGHVVEQGEAALEQRLDLGTGKRLEAHRLRAEPLDAVADRGVDTIGDVVIERGQHREGDRDIGQRLGDQRAAADGMGEPALPALELGLLELVEGDEHRTAERADQLHQLLQAQARALVGIGIGDAHAQNLGVDRQAAEIVARIVVADQEAEHCGDGRFAGGRNPGGAGEPRADARDERLELGLGDRRLAAVHHGADLLRGEVGDEVEQRFGEPDQRHRRPFRHEIGLAQAHDDAAAQPGVELALGDELDHRQHHGEHVAIAMQRAYRGEQRVSLAGAGLALDQEQARGRVGVGGARLMHDRRDCLIGGRLDGRDVDRLLLGRAGNRCHRAENASKLGAFKGLKARIHTRNIL